MKFLAIIPARKGSKGIKNKNFKLFNGKPLIYWTLKSAKKSKYLDKILVSTDSKKIQNFCIKNNVLSPFIRPKKISHSKARAHDVILHTIKFLKNNYSYKPDAVVYLQPTSPLRTSDHIDHAFEKMIDAGLHKLVSVVEMKMTPFKAFKLDDKGNLFLFLIEIADYLSSLI